MDMQGSQLIQAPIDLTWKALNDPDMLKSCIMGCDSIVATGENAYDVNLGVKIGPVSAKFKGKLFMDDVQPPSSYNLRFEGSGGAAGFGKGNASVQLAPEGKDTRLSYTVNAQVGGKLAQIGSRLIDAAAKKMSDDFFKAFNAKVSQLAADNAAVAPAAPVAAAPAEVPTTAAPAAEAAPAPAAAVATSPAVTANEDAKSCGQGGGCGQGKCGAQGACGKSCGCCKYKWIAVGIVIATVVYYFARH